MISVLNELSVFSTNQFNYGTWKIFKEKEEKKEKKRQICLMALSELILEYEDEIPKSFINK